jgi:hypothetical protein
MPIFRCLGHIKVSFQVRGFVCKFFTTEIGFHSELLASCPTPKLEDPLSTARDCLFNIFTATLHIGGRSSIHNPRMHHAMVIGTHLQHGVNYRFNPLPALTYQSILDLNVNCQAKRTQTYWHVRKFKCPLNKTQPSCPCSNDLNWTGKGLREMTWKTN